MPIALPVTCESFIPRHVAAGSLLVLVQYAPGVCALRLSTQGLSDKAAHLVAAGTHPLDVHVCWERYDISSEWLLVGGVWRCDTSTVTGTTVGRATVV